MVFSEDKRRSYCFLLSVLGCAACMTVLYAQPRETKVPVKKVPIEALTHYKAFTIELKAINPGHYDANTDAWIQPYPMPANQSEIVVSYTLKNKGDTIPGHITAEIGGTSLLSSGAYPNTLGVIPANTNYSGQFHAYGSPPGNYTLTIAYVVPGTRRIYSPWGQGIYLDVTMAEANYKYVVPSNVVDRDNDAIDDREEQRLIDKYAPFLKFSYDTGDEPFRPTDPVWYIRHSELLTSRFGLTSISRASLSGAPSLLIDPSNANQGDSSLYSNQKKTDYRLNLDWDPDSPYYTGYYDGDGHDWPEVVSSANIGLFAHVAPYTGSPKQYKVEYWQFFGYNQAATLGALKILGPILGDIASHAGDHAGDWATVQLIVQPADVSEGNPVDRIISVFHYHHGNESRFDMSHERMSRYIQQGEIKEYAQSSSYDDDNTVQLYRDLNTGLYVHPVVYIEWGGHEFWPNTNGGQSGSPKHNGTGKYAYLCRNIPNLGEVDSPFGQDAKLILGFNGFWGAFNIGNNNPPGPSLHTEWKWPSNSPIRSGIPDGDFEN